MIRYVAVILMFITSAYSFDENVSQENIYGAKNIFNYVSTPHNEFKYPWCLAVALRQGTDFTDLDLIQVTGFTLTDLSKTIIKQTDPNGSVSIKTKFVFSFTNQNEKIERTIYCSSKGIS